MDKEYLYLFVEDLFISQNAFELCIDLKKIYFVILKHNGFVMSYFCFTLLSPESQFLTNSYQTHYFW